MNIYLYQNDIPTSFKEQAITSLSIDTETTGLNIGRDRLCLVQFCINESQDVHLVQFYGAHPNYSAPNLKTLLSDPKINKIFHFARFDIAVLEYFFSISLENIFCTKIASKLTRTFTDRHSLKELVKEHIGQDLSKQQQTSNWGNKDLTEDQKQYAANDVLYLYRLKQYLYDLLKREERVALAEECFKFLPTRARLDLLKWDENKDFFAHS